MAVGGGALQVHCGGLLLARRGGVVKVSAQASV